MSSAIISMTECFIATEILSRLPVKVLVRFKCVCKSWHDLISDPYFIQKHLDHSRKKPQLGIAPFTTTDDRQKIFFYTHTPRLQLTRLMPEKEFFEVESTVLRPQHVDGLLLLKEKTSLHVYNPSTGESITLPEHNSHGSDFAGEHTERAALGYVARNKCYKVVRYFYRHRDYKSKTYSLGLEVFELGGSNTSWRAVNPDPPYPISMCTYPVSIDGVIYFVILNWLHTSPPKGILAFDLNDDKFKAIDRPSCSSSFNVREYSKLMLSEMEGELCLVGITWGSRSKLDIWAYKKEEDSWIHAYDINPPYSWSDVAPIEVKRRKVLLYTIHHAKACTDYMHSLELYDPLTGLFQTLVPTLDDLVYPTKRPSPYPALASFQVFKYVESLVSIKTPGLFSR